jgi:hypothetical protein
MQRTDARTDKRAATLAWSEQHERALLGDTREALYTLLQQHGVATAALDPANDDGLTAHARRATETKTAVLVGRRQGGATRRSATTWRADDPRSLALRYHIEAVARETNDDELRRYGALSGGEWFVHSFARTHALATYTSRQLARALAAARQRVHDGVAASDEDGTPSNTQLAQRRATR